MSKSFRLPYIRNKKVFSYRGVIFEKEGPKERNAIVMCHWPYCGMDAKTARRLADWLLKRADDMEKKAEGVE